MKPDQSVVAFERRIASTGTEFSQLTPRIGFECMLQFYASVEAEGCDEPSADMLLFEWGTYDWGDGDHFELSISRQFIEIGEEGEPEISQLQLVFKYPSSDAQESLSAGNRWCDSRSDVQKFKQFVDASAGYAAFADSETLSPTLSHFYV